MPFLDIKTVYLSFIAYRHVCKKTAFVFFERQNKVYFYNVFFM